MQSFLFGLRRGCFPLALRYLAAFLLLVFQEIGFQGRALFKVVPAQSELRSHVATDICVNT
eukprot:1251388-Amphidinium_carterae.1